jgi:hypothetical protein
MRSCLDIAAAGSAKSKTKSFSALILHKIQNNGVKDQLKESVGAAYRLDL